MILVIYFVEIINIMKGIEKMKKKVDHGRKNFQYYQRQKNQESIHISLKMKPEKYFIFYISTIKSLKTFGTV